MGRGRKDRAKQPAQAARKSQSQHDREFEERQRIAERLVRILREAGYFCHIGGAPTLRRDN
jgi:hypothetical protein